MKILLAGASGAIGQPAIDRLMMDGQEVYGITHSEERAQIIAAKGAKPIILDVLDRDAVFATIASVKPAIVIDMLTSLPKKYTPESMSQSAAIDAKIRREGGGNLQAASAKHGVLRYIVQSSAFWYAPGCGFADENCSFAFHASEGIAKGCHLYAEIEKRVLQAPKLEGVALRLGFLYGPGTWFTETGDMATQVRRGQFPLIGKGQGIWNFVHIDDVAKAIASAVYCSPGAYNIVNDRPSPLHEWLPAFARYLGAPPPPLVNEEEGLKTRGADSAYYATQLRGASNAKAKLAFNFEPRTFEWLL